MSIQHPTFTRVLRLRLKDKHARALRERAGRWVEVVNEAYTTQTCSACGARTGPKGREGLGMAVLLREAPRCNGVGIPSPLGDWEDVN